MTNLVSRRRHLASAAFFLILIFIFAQARAQNLSTGAHLSYTYVGQRFTAEMATPAVVLLYEPLSDHEEGSNFLFGDGHVDFLPAATADQVVKQIQNGINPPKY